MASTSISYTATQSSADITLTLSGLSNPANTYDSFAFVLYRWSGSSWVLDAVTQKTSSSSGNSVSHVFTDRQINTFYYGSTWANFDGTWYPDDLETGFTSSAIYTEPPPPPLEPPSPPTNVSVAQPQPDSLSVDIYYQWGTNATGMDIRFSTNSNMSSATTDENIQNDFYPAPSHNMGVGTTGAKYFQVRSRRTSGGETALSSWVNASPFPLFITDQLPRPANWNWSYNISSGSDVYGVSNEDIFIMPANEWNNFTNRINQFRQYKALSNASFTTVGSGTAFTTTIINQALNAIRGMSSHFTGGNTLPTNRSSGDNILVASYYTRMRDCLNSIT